MYVNLSNTTSLQVFELPARGQVIKRQTLEISKPAAEVGVLISASFSLVGFLTSA